MIVRIEDEHQIYEFDGDRIAGPVSTRFDKRSRQRARWMEATLYRKSDGTGYIFYQVSYSIVWHLPDAFPHIRKPLAAARSELPQRAVYCGVLPSREGRDQCPAAVLGNEPDAVSVLAEMPQYKVWAFPDTGSLIQRLTVARHSGDGSASAATSGPMHDLLAEAARNDPAFASGAKPVVSL